jgi:hypothetical protein
MTSTTISTAMIVVTATLLRPLPHGRCRDVMTMVRATKTLSLEAHPASRKGSAKAEGPTCRPRPKAATQIGTEPPTTRQDQTGWLRQSATDKPNEIIPDKPSKDATAEPTKVLQNRCSTAELTRQFSQNQ